jgi:hypothetical protein
VSAARPPDPQGEAERKLRLALAAEARAERALRGRIQKGFYGCVTVIVALLLFMLFFL